MRALTTRTTVALATGALALAGVLGAAGTAAAAPAGAERAVLSGPVLPPVHSYRNVWSTVNLRLYATGDSRLLGKLYGGNSYAVSCWKYGQSVTAEGTTNNVWILARSGSGTWGYSSAIYFSGDKYGNLPASAKC